MPRRNTSASYGTASKTFHWLTALLILTNIPLGWLARGLADEIRAPGFDGSEAVIARAALLFSVHKTLGLVILATALARIAWALSQPKPGLVGGDRRLEALAAETVHWLLYGSLVAVPLSGWVYHAATTGFAPIWWPFGQTLPLVSRDETVAAVARALHVTLQWVLVAAIGLHVAGALKHHLIDGDATLRRMLPGGARAEPSRAQPGHLRPAAAALAIWGAALAAAAGAGWFVPAQAPSGATRAALPRAQSEWRVEDGRLGLTVTQMGMPVTGTFGDWTAQISYARTPDAAGRHGAVEVTVAIASLQLGSVSAQAKGADFLDAGGFPVATFSADLVAVDGQHVARGHLTIRGRKVPVEMPFALDIASGTAHASGRLVVDRRDFGIGAAITDAGTLGFDVEIAFELTATRAAV